MCKGRLPGADHHVLMERQAGIPVVELCRSDVLHLAFEV
jgi:hypothetical protein